MLTSLVVCIDGLETDSNPAKPILDANQQSPPPTDAIEPIVNTPLANEPEMFSTGSEVMDDILEHSQQRMLEAFSHLSRRVDGLAIPRSPDRSNGNVNLGHLTSLERVHIFWALLLC